MLGRRKKSKAFSVGGHQAAFDALVSHVHEIATAARSPMQVAQIRGASEIEPLLTNVRIRQLYLPDADMLLTRFLAEEGVAS